MTEYARLHRARWSEGYGWPAGALAACDDIESQFPRWFPIWHPGAASGIFQRAGYYAVSRRNPEEEATLYAATPAALRDLIAAAEDRRSFDELDRQERRLQRQINTFKAQRGRRADP